MDSFYNFRFLSWVQEIYCDFYAAKIIADSKRKSLIDSINYKMKNKDGTIQGISHPSWNNRLKYATNYNFDEKLIKQIYTDSGCKNETLLNEAIEFYKNKIIILKKGLWFGSFFSAIDSKSDILKINGGFSMLDKLQKFLQAPDKISTVWLVIILILTPFIYMIAFSQRYEIYKDILLSFNCLNPVCLALYAHHIQNKKKHL